MVDQSPAEDPVLNVQNRLWQKPGVIPNHTGTRGAFKTYSTLVISPCSRLASSGSPTMIVPGLRGSMQIADGHRTAPKLKAWEPTVAPRG